MFLSLLPLPSFVSMLLPFTFSGSLIISSLFFLLVCEECFSFLTTRGLLLILVSDLHDSSAKVDATRFFKQPLIWANQRRGRKKKGGAGETKNEVACRRARGENGRLNGEEAWKEKRVRWKKEGRTGKGRGSREKEKHEREKRRMDECPLQL